MKRNTSLVPVTPKDINYADSPMELYIMSFLRNRTEYFGPSFAYKGSVWDLYVYLNGEDDLNFDEFTDAYNCLVEKGIINSTSYNRNGNISQYTSFNLPVDFEEVC